MSHHKHPLRQLLSAVILVTCAAGVQAASHGERGGMHHGMHQGMERMAGKLSLSEEQRAQARQLFDQRRASMRELASERRELYGELREYIRGEPEDADGLQQIADRMADVAREQVLLHGQTQRAFYQMLDDEQRERMDGLRQERREKWRERRGQRGEAGKRGHRGQYAD